MALWMMAVGVLSASVGEPGTSGDAGRPAVAPEVDVSSVLRSGRTTSGQRIEMPKGDVEVVVSRYSIPPGFSLAAHRHPFPRYGYVLAGRLRVENLETHQTTVFDPGSFIVEDVGKWHAATSLGDASVELLVMDFVRSGQGNVELERPK